MKKRVFVYGAGGYFRSHFDDISKNYSEIRLFDTNKTGLVNGIEIEKLTKEVLQVDIFDAFLIMVMNEMSCYDITRSIVQMADPEKKTQVCEKIVWGISIFGRYPEIRIIDVYDNGGIKISYNGSSVKTCSVDEFVNSFDTLANECYKFSLNNGRRDVIFDIGMNIGDSTLYFLNRENTRAVIGYEPFNSVFKVAEENLLKYMNDDRLELCNYGLSSSDRMIDAEEIVNWSCGNTTVLERDCFFNAGERNRVVVQVKKASDVIRKIIDRYTDCNIILKIDCEGEEYAILEDLSSTGVLKQIDYIMMEWHMKGSGFLIDTLAASDFIWCSQGKTAELGLIYAWNRNSF